MERKYKVYVHIFPNGKKYFGITGKKPEARWESGTGYSKDHQPVMYNAIQKYGWDNVEHKILYENLTLEEAQNLEIELIAKYKTNCHKYGDEYGYNMTDGGEGSSGRTLSDEAKLKISQAQLGRTGAECPNSKPVICDGVEYSSVTEFKEKNKVKGDVIAWLNGKKGMAIEWYEKGLHYKDQDSSIIYPQEKPWNNIIIYNNKEYSSQAELARELGVVPAAVCHWLKGDSRVPQHIAEKGLKYKDKPNNNISINPTKPVYEYDGKIFTIQRRLAEYMGEKYATVNSWVKGKNSIPQYHLDKGFKIIK